MVGMKASLSPSSLGVSYLKDMKWLVFSIVLACTTSATAQFIPQPLGYNPDENADGLIGVGDLQGLLALYGNAFDNGDSTEIETITFSAEDQAIGGSGYSLGSDGCCLRSISESSDIVYLHSSDYADDLFIELPAAESFKTLLVLCSTDVYYARFLFHDNGLQMGMCNPPTNYPRYFIFIRGHNGRWYRHQQ